MEHIYDRNFFERAHIGDNAYDKLERDEAYCDYYGYLYPDSYNKLDYTQEDPRDYGSYDYFDCVY